MNTDPESNTSCQITVERGRDTDNTEVQDPGRM